MRKVFVFLVVIFVFFGAYSAQNANAQSSNDTEKIVGTWVMTSNNNVTFTFNADGTFESFGYIRGRYAADNFNGSGAYIISGSKLIFENIGERTKVGDYYFSTDGNTLVIDGIAGGVISELLLKKQ